MTDLMTDIRKLLADKRLVIGTEQTLKLLKVGKLAKVYVSSNCPPALKEDLRKYSGLNSIECQDLPVPNEELGVWCKKNFAISVLGVLKSAAA